MIPTIFFIGEVSSGKSSLINAIAGEYITCVSLQRETFYPTKFEFKKEELINTNFDLKTEHENNIKQRQKNVPDEYKTEIPIINIKVADDCDVMNIIDFPGLNDGQDSQDKYMNYIKDNIHHADMICFITDAATAFVKKSELDTFNKIKTFVKNEWDNNRHYIELCIVVNKYDNNPKNDDEDLKDIYERIPKNNKTFRICSHKLLCHRLLQYNKSLNVPEFMINETKKILKNAESRTKFSKKILFKIHELPKIDSLLKGDWDNLLTEIRSIIKINNRNATILLEEIYTNLLNDIKNSYLHNNHSNIKINDASRPSFSSDGIFYKTIIDKKNTLTMFFNRACRYKMNMTHQYEKIINAHIEIIDKYKSNSVPQRLIYLEYLFVTLQHDSLFVYLVPFLVKNRNFIATETLLYLVHHIMISFGKISNKYIEQLHIFLLRKKEVHNSSIPFSTTNKELVFADTGSNRMEISYIDNHNRKHDSWYINNLINASTTDNKIKYFAYLSTKQYIVIKQLINDNMLRINYFDVLESYTEPNFLKRLEIECNYQTDINKHIESNLFAEKFSSHQIYLEYSSFIEDTKEICHDIEQTENSSEEDGSEIESDDDIK